MNTKKWIPLLGILFAFLAVVPAQAQGLSWEQFVAQLTKRGGSVVIQWGEAGDIKNNRMTRMVCIADLADPAPPADGYWLIQSLKFGEELGHGMNDLGHWTSVKLIVSDSLCGGLPRPNFTPQPMGPNPFVVDATNPLQVKRMISWWDEIWPHLKDWVWYGLLFVLAVIILSGIMVTVQR